MKELLQENLSDLNLDKQTQDQSDFEKYKNVFKETRQLGDIHQSEEIFTCIVKIVPQIVEFSGVGLVEKEQYSDSYFLKKEHHLDGELDKHMRRLERSGCFKWVCESETVSLIPPAKELMNAKPVIIVPLLTGKKIVGAVVIFPKKKIMELNYKDSELLALLGTQAGIALENARLNEEMAIKNQVLSSMRSYLENSIESVGEGIIAVDSDGKISLFNSSVRDILGVECDTAIGLPYKELFDPEFVIFLDQLFESTLTTGECQEEYSYQHPVTKKLLPLEMHATILHDTEKKHVGAIAVCRDLTEHQELYHYRKLDQLKDEFISTVSHELRTPLTSIKSFIEILKDMETSDPVSRNEFLQIIDKESDRLIQLIEELLDISKINRGEMNSEISIVDVDNVCKKSMLLLKGVADKKNITLDLKLSDDLIVLSDENRLIQVFVNLIGNALKFSPENSTINIWSEQIPGNNSLQKNNYLKIAIQDEGIGIPKDSLKTIFEKFKQVREDPSTKPDGNGLGLWLCKQILLQQGGNIWAESERKKGSTFFFTLQQPE